MGGWAWGISGAIVALLVGAWLTRGLLRCLAVVRELERGLVALGQGRPVRPTNTSAPGSVGRLAKTFDAVAPELQDRVGRLGRDVEQLRVVLGGMAEGVIAIDARRRLLFANKSADLLFGLGPQAVGRLPRVLAIHGALLPGSSPSGAVLVFHDVTELRRLERMRQDFVANVSHELKTPLASIKAYTETLLDWALHDEEVNVRFLNRIEEQAERLNQLILDLLSLARLESGQEVFHHGPLALSAVVETCIETHKGRAEAKDLDLRLDLGPVDESTLVMADEEAIHQILDNLIDNAIKYTPARGWVRVACKMTDEEVELEVADSGIGIPRDDLPRIFERFYRVDKARSREMGGTGLGLSIVKHLIQSIGGQITVDSRLGEGTRFTVELPRYQPSS
jgi:two-component system phosphate regulon sensor histidine kinase PhoR